MKESLTRPLCSFLIVFAVFSFTACGAKRSEEAISKEINNSLRTKSPNVIAKVHDGTVELNGECHGENCADSITAIVREIDGVKDVQNEVREVEEKTDPTLRTSVQTVSKYQGVQADVAAGVVVLRGIIQRDQLQPMCAAMLMIISVAVLVMTKSIWASIFFGS